MLKSIVKNIFKFGGIDIRRYQKRYNCYTGLFNKYQHYTMVPDNYFYLNLDLCNAHKNIKGDYVECGVWRGGMSAAIAEILGKEKRIHLFDSFEGLPPAKEVDGKAALAWQQNTASSGYYNNCTAE